MAAGIHVHERRTQTIFRVSEWPFRDFTFPVYTSNVAPLVELGEPEWKRADLKRIEARKRNRNGAAKGRVLVAVQYMIAPSRWEGAGVALLTAPPGKPLRVYHVCYPANVNIDDRALITNQLLRVARELACRRSRRQGILHWLVPAVDAGPLCELYGFTSLAKRGALRQRGAQAVLEWRAP